MWKITFTILSPQASTITYDRDGSVVDFERVYLEAMRLWNELSQQQAGYSICISGITFNVVLDCSASSSRVL